ncbi:pheromone precursor protein [Sporothrix brasiliensis 5110]|uniref:Pheromone protein n=1 Tax=Sporothrix brasiliensis 5110 TaxID=1398154 RepID=A0A0C2JAT3_9PEZI|nr:pheromone precursor protein [Sporothrix brasiliensis 5110]KIH94007.1 pheromone precursor protein [Sporothrix brasiliensis 5110]
MKTAAVFTILAVGASAAAVAEAEAYCQQAGQSCYQVKRAAEAFAEAIADLGAPEAGVSRRSLSFGGVHNNAIRAIDGLASIVASTQYNPRSFYSDLSLESHFPVPVEEPVTKREAEADADADAQKYCPLPGQPCWKNKREADAAADAEAQKYCPLKGQSCWKARRAAEAVINAIEGGSVQKREAEADADAEADAQKYCPLKGQSCWKYKREAEADAEAQKYCPLKGQSCWKRNVGTRCYAPGGACANASRDLHAIYNAARSVIESLPKAE